MVWKFILVCMVMMSSLVGPSNSACEFDAIFNFGDSNSDTGGFNAAFPAQGGPYGMTYFKKPVGRACDGRLIVDFLAQALGLPFLSPYLQSIGSDFRHGANFATSASTVLEPTTSLFVGGLSPFSLEVQLRQMEQFKARVGEFYQQSPSKFLPRRKVSYGCSSGTNLPCPNIFRKSIYTFYFGQNDFTSKLYNGVGGEGLKYNNRACRGHGGGAYNFDPKIMCGNASACDDPQNYVSWDGIHFTEAANKLVTYALLNGSLFDPPFPLHQHCDLKPIY